MQRLHRRWHRVLWLVLGPLALAAFLYAVLNRPGWPVLDRVPRLDVPSTSSPDP